MSRNTSGFTMVELTIVLLLLGIVSAVAVPSINSSLNEMKLDGAAREVISALQYAQSISIKEGVSYGVDFDVINDKFRCYENSPGNVILHPIDKKPYLFDLKAGHLQGVNINSATFAVGSKVEFNDLGEPSSPGTIVLGYAGSQRIINVAAPTGKISVN